VATSFGRWLAVCDRFDARSALSMCAASQLVLQGLAGPAVWCMSNDGVMAVMVLVAAEVAHLADGCEHVCLTEECL
jgi:hypothetical protein